MDLIEVHDSNLTGDGGAVVSEEVKAITIYTVQKLAYDTQIPGWFSRVILQACQISRIGVFNTWLNNSCRMDTNNIQQYFLEILFPDKSIARSPE